jgi:tetratricopeptide (TPR) repeat protein
LGDSLFLLGKMDASRQGFLRALQVNPRDARACFNLAFVYHQEKEFDSALSAIARGLAHDPAGEFREALLQEQAQILGHLAGRFRQECQLGMNRVSKPSARVHANGSPKPTSPEPAAANGKDQGCLVSAGKPLQQGTLDRAYL